MTGYRNDDFRPFIWKTTDFGQTWTSIAGNLPQEAINVVRESPRNADVLFVGTDLGVYVTIDGGKSVDATQGRAARRWRRWRPRRWWRRRWRCGGAPRGVLPTVPVHDLKIHPRDRELIAGTHGRGIWIADISEIEEMTPAVLASDAHLFEIDPVIRVGRAAARAAPPRRISRASAGPTDMGISYFLKSEPAGDVKVRVYNGSRVIAEIDGAKTAGVNTVRWNLQARRERIAGEAAPAGRWRTRRRTWRRWRRRRSRRAAGRRPGHSRPPGRRRRDLSRRACRSAAASTRSSGRSCQTRGSNDSRSTIRESQTRNELTRASRFDVGESRWATKRSMRRSVYQFAALAVLTVQYCSILESCRMIVWSRSDPVEMIAAATPLVSSSRRM